MTTEDWITTAEAAELSGYHAEHLRELLRSGKVRGRKFGRLVWQVDRQSLKKHMELMRERGEKSGPKTAIDKDIR